MAYDAVISLKQTIHRLLNSSNIPIISSTQKILEFASNEVTSLQKVLETLDDSSRSSSKRLNALYGQIREVVHEFEDLLEFHETDDQFLSQSESHGDDGFLCTLSIEISSFVEKVKKMKGEYIEELDNPLPEEDDDAAVSSSIDFGVEMVGLSDEFIQIRNHLLAKARPDDFIVYSFVGIIGSCRTIAAKTIFEEFINGEEQYFDCGAWVTVGPKYQFKEILLSILAQIDHKLLVSEGDEKKIAEYLYSRLKGRRYLIALVDVGDTWTWDHLRSSFPEQNNGSLVLLTTELDEINKIKEELQMYNSFPHDVENFTTLVLVVVDTSDLITPTKMQLFPERWFPKMGIMSFIGMAGIGKTTFVKKIFEDQSIMHHFDHRVWITLGPKYQSEEILVDILAQVYPNIDKMHMKGDAGKDLCTQLCTKRCLIVLDDVWNKEPLYYIKKLFPTIKGKALVTTRLGKVTEFGKGDIAYDVLLLNKEDSWRLFCQKVFPERLCPFELEKAGKMISENCEGLPLLILTVADLLSKAEKTPEYWNMVAKKQNSVFMEAQDQMSKVLSPSYKYLPHHLRTCFLYMAVFPQNYNIPRSELINLWIAERILEPNPSQIVEDFFAECLLELVDSSLVMSCQKGSNSLIKTCRLHSAFWHLSNSEVVKNKFFHAFNTYAVHAVEGLKSQRRLCIRNSILLGNKDVHNAMASIPAARSLLCTGPPHKYPVPIYLGLSLLRVLDARRIRFYDFPIEVVKMIHLTYLALTCNGKLPNSISQLWNLQFLIVTRHLSIKPLGDSSFLPMEVWDLKELKHLKITGSNLPNPNCGAVLPKLLTLLDVSVDSCRKRILKGIPNLKRLGIRIELTPNDNENPFRCLNRISRLRRLESLKCVVVNPKLMSNVVAPAPLSMFPSSLKKLSLSGLGYPWEYMSIIGKLKNLEVLKLRNYAFRGRDWETKFDSFPEIKFLLIEDTDLVHWNFHPLCFLNLECLSIKHCYRLEQLPYHLVEMIEVVDCNPLVVDWAKLKKRE